MVLPDAEVCSQGDRRVRRVLARRRGHAVAISARDELFLARARELAARGIGSTAPNPPVGAVIVRDGRTLGEGYHRVRGGPHAEVEAIEDARRRGHAISGATMYVSLEPCDHYGRTPPCSQAVIAAGIARVAIGAADPNPRTNGAGIARLRDAGVAIALSGDPASAALIEHFAHAVRSTRPFVTLKMAASLDGYVAPEPGSYWLTSEVSRERVRELRWAHDAVMVGAGTIRTDDPLLTVRPIHARRRPYLRVVAAGDAELSPQAAVFAPQEPAGCYERTLVLAPAGARARFAAVEAVADCAYVGAEGATSLDPAAALTALKDRGACSVLCEGGPTLAAALLRARLVDRLVWFAAPVFLSNPRAVPALGGEALHAGGEWEFETLERSGKDLMMTARLRACSGD